MKELSLHILDIVENSIKAEASIIRIEISNSKNNDELIITIEDNGRGMSPEFLARVRDPFTTTRTTRKAGMGISLFESAAVQTGGSLTIESQEGVGTTLCASFVPSSIDCAPLGDMAATMVTIISGAPDIDYLYHFATDNGEFVLDTKELRSILGDVSFNTLDVLEWIRSYVEEGMSEII